MATETSTETVTTDATGETPATAVTPQATSTDSTSATDQALPDSHPLVKAYEATKAELRQLKQSGHQGQDKLADDLKQAQDKLATLTPVQARYDRLEAFLSAVGGPLSKALDSKSFTTALFESDTDVTELVTKWHRDNPSATSSALTSSAGNTASKSDFNTLLRKAAQ